MFAGVAGNGTMYCQVMTHHCSCGPPFHTSPPSAIWPWKISAPIPVPPMFGPLGACTSLTVALGARTFSHRLKMVPILSRDCDRRSGRLGARSGGGERSLTARSWYCLASWAAYWSGSSPWARTRSRVAPTFLSWPASLASCTPSSVRWVVSGAWLEEAVAAPRAPPDDARVLMPEPPWVVGMIPPL